MFLRPGEGRTLTILRSIGGIALVVGGAIAFLQVLFVYTDSHAGIGHPYAMARASGAKCPGEDRCPLQAGFGHATKAQTQEIQSVIRAQLIDFRDGDYTGAIKYASGRFSHTSTASFKNMVEGGYPEVAHNKSVSFGLATVSCCGEEAFQNVTVKGLSGRRVTLLYVLEHETGGWRISGVSQAHTPHPMVSS